MAEDFFNPNQEIFVSNDAPSYWYYSSKDDHRFDKHPIGNFNHWKAKRSVSAFYNLDTEEQINVKNYKGSVYVFMYEPTYDDEYNLIDYKIIFNGELNFLK